MSLNNFVRDYLNFSRKDRIGILVLLALLLFIFFLPSFRSLLTARKRAITDSSWIQTMIKLEENTAGSTKPRDENAVATKDRRNDYEYDKSLDKTSSLFYHDPNRLSESEWKKLGIPDRTIKTIRNYLANGGQFRRPEDLQKIYGLKQNDYERLAPYIKIETKYEKTSIEKPAFEKRKEETNFQSRTHYLAIDINLADSTAFIALPGIGSKLAARIINFREKLGGFYTVDQVKETYGLQDSVFQKIKRYLKQEKNSVKKINLNTATKEELKIHPYIKWNIADAIIQYRNQHGNYTRLEDLKKVHVVNDEVFEKLVNYITL
ncbi:MAG: helix-hairpin-helix protein [Chitinophagaceae bacterium]|nr:helix-hairpin-helix protein [Chitinophagaceae bacterium]